MQPKAITIDRQYGSCGREIGEKLAAILNIPCYDKTLLELTAKKTGYCENVVRQFDETHSQRMLFSLAISIHKSWYVSKDCKPLQASVREAQVEIIRELAKDPCVIIGRAADSILADMNCTSIFIYADEATRIQRIMQRRKIPQKEATNQMVTADTERARFYSHYSGKRWGDVENYHLSVDSGKLGIDKTVDVILCYLNHLPKGE